MKRFHLLSTLGLFFLLCGFAGKPLFKKGKFHPPGTVQINDYLYFDAEEVSNFSWLDYEYWTKNEYPNDPYLKNKALPDSSVWRTSNSALGVYGRLSFRYTPNFFFPVVGITHQQAQDYCKWRTERVKKVWEAVYAGKKGRIIPDFEYRLPTKKEWLAVAALPYSKKTKRKQEKLKWRNKAKMNAYDEQIMRSTPHPLSKVYAFWPNEAGVYNMFGNVSEMIEQDSISLGGGWIHFKDNMTLENEFPYTRPTNWLGFRCVCEIKP